MSGPHPTIRQFLRDWNPALEWVNALASELSVMAASRRARLLAPWPKRIALFLYALLILLTIASGAIEFRFCSGTRTSPTNTVIGIESGRILFAHGPQLWLPTFVDFNYDGWKWWIDFYTKATPRILYVCVPLWMLLVLFGALGAALPVFLLRGHCRHCGYDMRGHPSGSQICPECGEPIIQRGKNGCI